MVMKTNRSAHGAVNELYLTALNRYPSQKEVTGILNRVPLRGVKDTPTAQFEDLFWALLNCNEFLLNH